MKSLCFDLKCDGNEDIARDLTGGPSLLNAKSIVDPVCEAVYDDRFQKHLAKLAAKKDAGIKITRADCWYD